MKLSALLSVLVVSTIWAQPVPDTLWTRMYGGDGGDGAGCIQQTADSGYIIAGRYSIGNNGDCYLVKTDQYGNVMWTHSFGGEGFDKAKPIFGLAKREEEKCYKVSGRAHETIVNKGVNLSEAIREACRQSDLNVLGGGHPPAAGTKIPIDKADIFLENCNIVIRKQLYGK